MKRVVVASFLLALLGLAPGFVFGQGLLPDMSFLPGVGGLFKASQSSGCYESKTPSLIGPPIVWVGYGRHRRGATFSAEADNPLPVLGIDSLKHDYPVEGVHLEGAVPVTLPGAPLAFLGGSYFFHAQNESRETYGVGAATVGRTWDTDTQWWTAQALLAKPIYGGVLGVGGFRFDSWMTNFDDPTDDTVGGLPTDVADVTLGHYIPFFGLLVSHGFGGGTMNVGVVGFPTLVGSIDYKELVDNAIRVEASGNYSSGSFFEVFADYSVNIMGANVGIFGRYSDVHGRATIDADVYPGPNPQTDMDFRLDRKVWLVGGKLSVDFNLL